MRNDDGLCIRPKGKCSFGRNFPFWRKTQVNIYIIYKKRKIFNKIHSAKILCMTIQIGLRYRFYLLFTIVWTKGIHNSWLFKSVMNLNWINFSAFAFIPSRVMRIQHAVQFAHIATAKPIIITFAYEPENWIHYTVKNVI